MTCAMNNCQKIIKEGIIINSPLQYARLNNLTKLQEKVHIMEVICLQCVTTHKIEKDKIGEIKILDT